MQQINQIINQEAAKHFKPYGIKRKGQSRFYLADHGWFLILVEFQPSDHGKGTYLNIGINFNWNLQDYFSFDIGHRENKFIEFVNEKQFSEAINELCKKAIEKVNEYRRNFKDIKNAERFIMKYKYHSDEIWGNYHRGIVSGLLGKNANMNKYFNKILKINEKVCAEWVLEFKNTVKQIQELANTDINAFKEKIISIINETRKLKRLDEIEIIFC
jgi:hypothetical protein